MGEIHYCKSWFSAKRRPTVVWDEQQARRAHQDRTQYTALLGSLERPSHVVLVVDKFVAVDFLDEELREELSYHFKEIEPGHIFLTMATHREFDGDTDEVTGGTSYIFKQDGSGFIRRETFNPHVLDEAQTSSLDVTGNYDRYPDFGDYDHLTARER